MSEDNAESLKAPDKFLDREFDLDVSDLYWVSSVLEFIGERRCIVVIVDDEGMNEGCFGFTALIFGDVNFRGHQELCFMVEEALCFQYRR